MIKRTAGNNGQANGWQQWSSERFKLLRFPYIAYIAFAFIILVTERIFSRIQFILNVVSISC
jgi:hypothetical protein